MITWDEDSIDYLLRAKGAGQSYQQIAKKLGTTSEAIRSKYRKLLRKHSDSKPDSEVPQSSEIIPAEKKHKKIPQKNEHKKAPLQPLTLDLHDCLVASDFHTPGENERAVQALIEYAIKHKVKHLIIAGDFWNQDSVSRWELKDPQMSLSYEIEQGLKLIHRLTKYMNLYFVKGNHDIRLCKAINYALTFSDWMKSITGNKFNKTVFVTNFDYLYLKSDNTKFRICHPDMYSRIKGSQVTMLAHDLQENVMMGHQHFFSMTTNKTGKYVGIDLGCMCDTKKFLYKNASTSRCPEWENAFVHVKGGRVHPITWYSF